MAFDLRHSFPTISQWMGSRYCMVRTNTHARSCWWCIVAGWCALDTYAYVFSAQIDQVTPSSGVISSPPSPNCNRFMHQPVSPTNNKILVARNEIVGIMMIVILMHYNHSSVSHSTNGSPKQRPLFAPRCYHYFIIFFFFCFSSTSSFSFCWSQQKKNRMRWGRRMMSIRCYYIDVCARARSRFHCLIVSTQKMCGRRVLQFFFFFFFFPSLSLFFAFILYNFIHSFCCLCAVVVHYIFLLSHTMTQWYSHVNVCVCMYTSGASFRTTLGIMTLCHCRRRCRQRRRCHRK